MGDTVKVTRRKSRLKQPTIGDWIIVGVMILLILSCILPVLTVVARSFSDPGAIMRQEVVFVPVGFHVDAYADILNDGRFMRSLGWTAILTVMFTLLALFMTVLAAYPLTYDQLKGRKIITLLIIFTMYFHAGTIPMFLLYQRLGILNTPSVLILPGLISVFLMIIMRKFFLGIPESLKESAEIDGASPFTILIKIYLPLSTPALATLGLMYAVGRWNGFADALMFLTGPGTDVYHPIQLLLFQILQGQVGIDTTLDPGVAAAPGRIETVRSAAIVVAMVPILCVYPWLQKYFVSGVTLGAVKG